ncbi:MAG: alpha-ketoglutarate-dependent dioxygenase AlkB [Chloroflexi bacterium]|nr:alpha-ketoglutarate-dependent dioxygenase AlkB [Chloroflexota bacterium]
MIETLEVKGFQEHQLDDNGLGIYIGRIPEELNLSGETFEWVWESQPEEYSVVMIHGRAVKIPRRQKAYGFDYRFSGMNAEADPVPPYLEPFLYWSRENIDDRFNGLLVNWYDGSLGHYIGPHHDDKRQLVIGSPIATISLGEERIFRMSRGKKETRQTKDFLADPGSVIVLPWETNLVWKHSVPKFSRYKGRRISITLRGFEA